MVFNLKDETKISFQTQALSVLQATVLNSQAGRVGFSIVDRRRLC